jgi:Sec-independent protein translocase protein TatA
LLIIAVIILVWYCSSMYPEAARRLGARAWGALRDAASSLVDRLLRRHHSEVKSNSLSARSVRRRCLKKAGI